MNTLSQTPLQSDLNHDYVGAFSAKAFSSRKLWSIVDNFHGSSLEQELHKYIAASAELIRRNEFCEAAYFYEVETKR